MSDLTEKGHPRLRLMQRVVFAAAYLAVCVFISDALATFFLKSQAGGTLLPVSLPVLGELPVSTAVAASASIMLFIGKLKDIIRGAKDLWRYVSAAANFDFPQQSLNVITALLPLILVINAPTIEPPAPPAPVSSEPVEVRFQYDFRYVPKADRLAVFPLTFADASLDPATAFDTGQSYGHEPPAGLFANGVSAPEHRISVERLVSALLPCAGVATTENVRMVVRGYASSKAFRQAAQYSDRLNLWAANARALSTAQTLIEVIREARASDRILVTAELHRSFEAMRDSRLYNDRPGGVEEENPSELFNRSVTIELVSAGNCSTAYSGPG